MSIIDVQVIGVSLMTLGIVLAFLFFSDVVTEKFVKNTQVICLTSILLGWIVLLITTTILKIA